MSSWNEDQLFSSASNEGDESKDEWVTPTEIFDPLMAEFDFEIDAAASGYNWMLPNYFGLDNGRNALGIDWPSFGTRFWCNPPYSTASDFLERGNHYASSELGLTMAFLVFARTDTEWWWRYVLGRDPKTKARLPDVACASEIRWHPGRIRFLDPRTGMPRRSANTGQVQAAPAPSVLIVFKPGVKMILQPWPWNGLF